MTAAVSSAAQMRAWQGPAVLSFGFRPFFLLAGIWAGLSMVLWIAILSGALDLPTVFDPISWHAHEFLFGYLGAVIAGFLLTAVPNWTGRLPVVGWRLGGLALLWIMGRGAVAFSAHLPFWAVVVADLAFLTVLAAVILREIVAGKNWRNLIVLGMLAGLIVADGLFYVDVARGDLAARGHGMRLGIAAGLMMVSVIGGRVIPSFTRNWLVKRGATALPVPPMQRFDKIVLAVTLATFVLWVIWPEHPASGVALLGVGVLHAVRLARWKGLACGSEPLVWVLHAGYALLPLGALLLGLAIVAPDALGTAPAQHVWMAGTFGLMTMAVMTRATLGHSGQALHAGRGTTGVYVAILVAVFSRAVATLLPGDPMLLYTVSGLAWCAAFFGFAALYGPLLLRPRQQTAQ